jgi:hypothetical protein
MASSSSLRSPAVEKVEAFGGGTARGSRTSEKSIESLSKARMWRLHARAARIVEPGEWDKLEHETWCEN